MLGKNLENILSVCASEFDVSIEDVKSNSRRQELVYCRKAFCIVVKEIFDLKNEILAKELNTSKNTISYFIATQPPDKYYIYCLERIKRQIKII